MSLWTEKRCAARDVFLRASSVMLLLFRWPFFGLWTAYLLRAQITFRRVRHRSAHITKNIPLLRQNLRFFSCTLSARASRFEEHIRSLCLYGHVLSLSRR